MKNQNVCYITGKTFDSEHLTRGDSLNNHLFKLIKKDFPDFEISLWINN